mmetsp:Transcript_16383/g.63934  ORF Transcript_16383/g.63934 Transcript_16383/m.63934 type:complete len:89 (-) Transcript_16383:87-353(-)
MVTARTDVQCRYWMHRYFLHASEFTPVQLNVIQKCELEDLDDLSVLVNNSLPRHAEHQIVWKFREIHGLPPTREAKIFEAIIADMDEC